MLSLFGFGIKGKILPRCLPRKRVVPTLSTFVVASFCFSEKKGESMADLFELCQQKNTQQAYEQFLSKKGSEPYHAIIKAILGHIHLEKKEYSKAFNSFAKSIKLDPKTVTPYLRLAEIIKMEGDSDYAIQVLQSGLIQLPENQQLESKLKSLYGEENYLFYRYSKKSIQKVQKDDLQQNTKKQQATVENEPMTSVQDFIDAIVNDSSNENIALQMKDYLLEKDKVTLGKTLFEDLTQKYQTFALNFGAGAFYFEVGEIQQAKNYLEKAHLINQNHFQVNLLLGILALKDQQIDSAIKYFEKAVEIQPEQSDPLTNLGLIYVKLADGTKAKDFFEKALKANSNDSIALSSMGTIKIAEGDLEEGLNNLRRALELDPMNETTRSNLVSTLFILGQHQQAESILGQSQSNEVQHQ